MATALKSQRPIAIVTAEKAPSMTTETTRTAGMSASGTGVFICFSSETVNGRIAIDPRTDRPSNNPASFQLGGLFAGPTKASPAATTSASVGGADGG